jgi:hypothetical protein
MFQNIFGGRYLVLGVVVSFGDGGSVQVDCIPRKAIRRVNRRDQKRTNIKLNKRGQTQLSIREGERLRKISRRVPRVSGTQQAPY